MYVHIHRKIEISKDLEVTAITWGGDENCIACGTSDGMIKLLKLEEATGNKDNNGTNSDITITVTDRLQHEEQGSINKLVFDRSIKKLTSTDNCGLINVWKYNKRQHQWCADMTSRRKGTFVSDFSWSTHNKIGVVYRDGFCLIGNQEGNREWAKEFDFELKLIAWSPNNKYILIVTMNYECLLYINYDAAKYKKHLSIPLGFSDKLSNDALEICDAKWNEKVLCIAYKIGKLQIMRDYNDKSPILVDVDMIITKIEFNPSGNIVAIVGRKKMNGEYTNWLCFVDCFGEILYQLSILYAGTGDLDYKINDVCWELNGSRVILCVGNIMYIAQVTNEYKYGYFAHSFLCYSNSETVYCWDTTPNSNYLEKMKFKKILGIAGAFESEFVLIINEINNKIYASLYNTIGRERVKNEITFSNANIFVITSLFAIIASKSIVYYFQHTQHQKLVELTSGIKLIDKILHIDNINAEGNYGINDSSKNPIQSIYGHKEHIIIARRFGDIMCYSMLSEMIEWVINTKNQGIKRIDVNKDISRLSVINKNGTLQIYDVNKKEIIIERTGKTSNVRNILWSYSDALRFALIEKNKLIIYDDLKQESSGGHKLNNNCICLFRDLEIIAFDLSRLTANPNKASLRTHQIKYECKVLSTLNDLLTKSGVYSAYEMVLEIDNQSKRKYSKLWQLLCYDSLKKLEFAMAENCFIKMADYFGIQFIKRLKLMNDRNKQRAEIYSYFGNIDDAELIYSKMNDKFEAINLYLKVGNFEKVIALIKKEKFTKNFNDKMMNTIYKQIGDYYSSKFCWSEALKYYLKSKDYKKASDAAYKVEDFNVLNQIVKQIPSSNHLLKKIGKMFIVNGLTKESATAFIKYGDTADAITNCIKYNDYPLAKELSIKYEHETHFNHLIQKKINNLNRNNKGIFEVIDIYKSINKHAQVAKLLISYIEKLKKNAAQNDPFLFQKLYVLSAIEIDRHRKELLLKNDENNIDLLLEQDVNNIDNNNDVFGGQCWNGAIAYHLYILLTKHIHKDNIGKNSLFISRILTEFYHDILNEINVYSLYAFVSYKCAYFKDCSNAMTRLQYLCDRKKDNVLKNKYKKLAINIFTKNDPINDYDRFQCKNINDKDFNINDICMASAQYIENAHINKQSFVMCNICKHKTLKQHIANYDFCPLCHSPF